MARLLAVAKTAEEAREVAKRGAGFILGSYMHQAPTQFFDPKGLGPERPDQDPVERYLSGVAIHGTPEQVVDELQRLQQDMFLDYLMCAPLSHESFVLFTEQVLPKFV
jgi:alkanesulfonate monooxygenase SsuD/methylene tetrahydromethanopterin reductase-like flavin-dependent oxidoreductase (luciferase family)